MTTETSTTQVAFIFADNGRDWQGGVNYFRALFLALDADKMSMLRPVVYVGAKVDVQHFRFPKNVQVRRIRLLDRMSLPWFVNKISEALFGVPLLFKHILRRDGVAVLSHCAPIKGLRNAAWIPDFQHVHLPQFFSEGDLRERDSTLRATIAGSDLVIVSSEAARNDLLAFSPKDAGKVRVLRFAAIKPVINFEKRLNLLKTHRIAGQFFYIPNQIWAHKNHQTVIEALALLKDLPDISVVCSGSLKDYRNPNHLNSLRAAIELHGLGGRFRFVGMVPYEQIAELMMQSIAVINPSLFEGWSTTVEEAKALGVPLILSDIAVHREQCEGLQASFFEAQNARELSQAMRIAVENQPPSPEQAEKRLRQAQNIHMERVCQFAKDYTNIINELAR